MPLGSSSDAPVIRPGPITSASFGRFGCLTATSGFGRTGLDWLTDCPLKGFCCQRLVGLLSGRAESVSPWTGMLAEECHRAQGKRSGGSACSRAAQGPKSLHRPVALASFYRSRPGIASERPRGVLVQRFRPGLASTRLITNIVLGREENSPSHWPSLNCWPGTRSPTRTPMRQRSWSTTRSLWASSSRP